MNSNHFTKILTTLLILLLVASTSFAQTNNKSVGKFIPLNGNTKGGGSLDGIQSVTAQVSGTNVGATVKFHNPVLNNTYNNFAGTFAGTIGPDSVGFYCIDLGHYIQYNHDYVDAGSTTPEITYVLNNHYPFKTLPYTGSLSAQKEAAAVQTAIWHFSDGLDLSTFTSPSDVKARAQEIIDDANANASSTVTPAYIIITPASQTVTAGSQANFTVSAVDENNNPIQGLDISLSTTDGNLSASQVTTDANGEATFSLDQAIANTATVTASATLTVPHGTKFVHSTLPDGKQKLVLATPVDVTGSAEAVVSWFTPNNGKLLCAIDKDGNKQTLATLTTTVLNSGDVKVVLEYSKDFNDNTYDDSHNGNTIGWPGGNHKFSHLAKSDKAEFEVFDGNNNSVIHFDLDYLESGQSSYPSNYGPRIEKLYSGNSSDIVNFNSSLSKNFNDYNYVLTHSSPATDSNYTQNPNYPNWNFNMVYEFTISANAFNGNGFGGVDVVSLHNSPSKLNFDNKVFPSDCGSTPKASIGDKVWEDSNQNGIQDNGENGVENVTVKLYDSSNNLLATTTTDANGNYLFDDLTPADYHIQFILPGGYVFTTKDANSNSNDEFDSDADEMTGTTVNTTLDDNENDMSWDAGIYQCQNTIGDFVWHDANVNGIQDNGEPGIEGVIVKLLDASGNFITSTTTDANGFYQFTGLPNGTYKVKIADDNFNNNGVMQNKPDEKWYITFANKGSDDAKDSDGSMDHNTVTVTLSCSDNPTIDFGFFKTSFTFKKTGPQTVNSGDVITYHFRVENTGDVILHGGVSVFDALINPSGNHQIWNHVVQPGEVFEFDKTYTATDNDCGQLVNNANAVGHPVRPDSHSLPIIELSSSWTTTVVCEQPGSIGDKVWLDTNENGIQDNGENGIPGITVNLFDCNNNFLGSTTTDNNGNYLFANLTPGDYYVQVVKPNGYVFSPKNSGSVNTVDSDVDLTNGKTTCTTIDAGENDLTWDAGMYLSKASIGDYVWLDTNENGIQDLGENGAANVTVKLYDCSDVFISSTTTDNNGNYLFDNLTPGDYKVQFILPSGFTFSPKNAGGNNTKDSDANLSNGKTTCTTLTAGETDLTWDAGIYEPAPDEADLRLVKHVDNVNPNDGDIINYTIKVFNDGPADASGVKVTDLLPDGVVYQSYSATQGTYVNSTGLWTVGSIANGAFATLTITAKVNVQLSSSSSLNLGPASDFNVFVLYDISQPSSDTEGKMAVGRNANLANYSVGDKLAPSNGSEDVLVVGNNLTYGSGAVYNGNVVYGHTTNLPQANVSITGGTLRNDHPIDFAAARAHLRNLSGQLKNYTTNGTTTFQYGGLTLTGTDPFLNVFKVDGHDLSNANNVSINVPNGSVVLVNVNRRNVSWSGGLSVTGTSIQNVMYNFYQAHNLTLVNIDIRGSLLAPYAKVNFIRGVINGQMVAKFIQGTGQFNNKKFIGNLPADSTVVNIAEITASLVHDPDSTPGNGIETEDDYDTASILLSNHSTGGGTGGSGNGGGSNWEYVGNYGAGQIIWSLTYDDAGNMYSGTWGGIIYKSTNGTDWTVINKDMHVGFIWALKAYNGYVFAATEQGVFRYDGTSWTLTNMQHKDVRTIVVDGDGYLYAGTWGFGVFKSTDDGATWTEVNTGLGYMLAIQAMTVTSDSHLFVGSVGGGVSMSSNGGTNWTKLNVGYDFIWALASSSDKVFAGTYGDGLYITEDDGTTWTKAANLGASYIYSITVDRNGKIYVSSWEAGVFVSEDDGQTWTSLGMMGLGVSSLMVSNSTSNSNIPSGTIFAGTSDGKLYKNSANGITGVGDKKDVLPTKFALEQNYPNPFNPSTTINYSIPVAGNYQLKVYNIIGEEVATLLNNNINAGNYSINFDASRLASGIYLYRLIGNKVNIVRKMILMK